MCDVALIVWFYLRDYVINQLKKRKKKYSRTKHEAVFFGAVETFEGN